MKNFDKRLKRQVTIRGSDPAIGNADWVLTLDGQGVRFHRLGHRSESWGLSWRSVIGVALVHHKRTDPDPPTGPAPKPKRRNKT